MIFCRNNLNKNCLFVINDLLLYKLVYCKFRKDGPTEYRQTQNGYKVYKKKYYEAIFFPSILSHQKIIHKMTRRSQKWDTSKTFIFYDLV